MDQVHPDQTAPTSDLGPHCLPHTFIHQTLNDSNKKNATDDIFRCSMFAG